MNDERGLSIVLPCLNEERTIVTAVKKAKAIFAASGLYGEVLVVDNGSTDRSAELARAAGARVIHINKRGYGEALRAGFSAAAFSYLAMADADLSYPLDELPKMTRLLDEGADFVLGNRLRGQIMPGAMPWLNRYLGTPVLSFCLRRLHAVPTYDCNGGMRVFRRAHLPAMNLQSSGMELASEMLVRAGQLKLQYREIPIPFYLDQRGRKPHLRRWRDGWRHLQLIVRSRLRTLV